MVLKLRENIPIQEAMDNLAAIASIDLDAPGPIGILKRTRLVTDEEEFAGTEVQWLSGEGSEAILEVLDATYRSIHHHLVHLMESPEMDWENEKQLQAVAAMMALAGESAARLEKYLSFRMGKAVPKISERAEYQALQHFYQHHFSKRVKSSEPHDVSQSELSNIDVVRRDQDYEFFYIRHEDGTPYFKRDLVRHMRLNCDFDSEGETFEEDPLLRVRAMMDRDLQASAGQILGDCHATIADFYKILKKVTENDLALSLSSALLALFLASNPRHLIQNSSGKTSLQYFEDFHKFLRRSMKTPEYQKWIAYPPEQTEKAAQTLLHLVHALCDSFFHRLGGVKQESIGLIHRTMRRGTEKKGGSKKGESIWTQFLYDDENFRELLAKFPNGPLFKILDLIRHEEEDQITPFDPIGQDNLPSKLYEMDRNGMPIEILRIPSPTRQSYIQKAEVLDEFRGFLRSYQTAKPARCHLMINLQDRTTWKESSRCRALEGMQKNAEFNAVFTLLTLPKSTDFYYQNAEYLNLNQAHDFITALLDQLKDAEQCGFTLPPQFKHEALNRFAEKALPFIHRAFFEKKNSLTRRNREDFIEIFYHFLILKVIDEIEPASISFTCKDAIDTGAALNASFFAFIKLLTADLNDRADQDYFRWLLYTPALFIRERAIDPERLNRTLSALERVDAGLSEDRKAILKEVDELYGPKFLKSWSIKSH